MRCAFRRRQISIAFAGLVLAGCGTPSVESVGGAGTPPPMPPAPSLGGPGAVLPPPAPSGTPTPGTVGPVGGEMTCAAQAFTAEKVPVDLHILLDSSLDLLFGRKTRTIEWRRGLT